MNGFQLKVKRIKASLKQYEVAAYVGMSPNKLCEIELGRRTASPELLDRISEAIERGKRQKS